MELHPLGESAWLVYLPDEPAAVCMAARHPIGIRRLLAAGPVTTVPLLCFAAAVRRLRLATLGLLQYISPTLQFTLAVAVFGEPLGRERLIAFVLIWVAIAIYSTAGWGETRNS